MKISTRMLGKFSVIDLVADPRENAPEEYSDSFETQLRENQGLILGQVEAQIGRANVRIVLNLLDAEYIHSGGMGLLATCVRKLNDCGGQLYVIVKNQKIREAIETIGLDDTLPVYTSEEQFKTAHLPANPAS